jgi:eukaryotic-like serine/threonine-protein kinase
MSPEQARGARDIDARSDVFSASILIYMMLAGKNPFESETFHSVISAIMQRDPPRLPDVPDAIWTVIEKGLAKDAAARYADATELGIALRRACGRTATTESGVHAVALPASERKIAVPLGGDSHVSVPPVGNGGDTASNSRPSGLNPPARKLAVRIVAAVVAASAALTTVALLRDPPGSSASAPPSATAEIPRGVSSAPRPAADATTVTLATATPSAAAAPSATESATPDAGVPRTQGAKKVVGPSPSAAPDVMGPDGMKEPALVRDPGF